MTKPTEAGTWVLLSRCLAGMPDDKREQEWRALSRRIEDGHVRLRYYDAGDESRLSDTGEPRTGHCYDPLPVEFWRFGRIERANWLFSAVTGVTGRTIIELEIFIPDVAPEVIAEASVPTAVDHPYRTGAPGRPTSSQIVIAEAVRRLDGGRPYRWRKDFAAVLSQWLASAHPMAAQMTPKTISGKIKDVWQKAGK